MFRVTVQLHVDKKLLVKIIKLTELTHDLIFYRFFPNSVLHWHSLTRSFEIHDENFKGLTQIWISEMFSAKKCLSKSQIDACGSFITSLFYIFISLWFPFADNTGRNALALSTPPHPHLVATTFQNIAGPRDGRRHPKSHALKADDAFVSKQAHGTARMWNFLYCTTEGLKPRAGARKRGSWCVGTFCEKWQIESVRRTGGH